MQVFHCAFRDRGSNIDFQLGKMFHADFVTRTESNSSQKNHVADIAVFVVPRRLSPRPSLELKLHGMGLASAQFPSREEGFTSIETYRVDAVKG